MITSMRYVLLVLGIILLERKERAAFVILARNGDLYGVLSSMKQMEDRFNKIFQYPYVFLNEIPFSGDFKSLTALTRYATEITGSPINEEKVAISRENMVQNQLIHGGSDHSDFVEHNKNLVSLEQFRNRQPLAMARRGIWKILRIFRGGWWLLLRRWGDAPVHSIGAVPFAQKEHWIR
ncbi:nucleotide-diphospho-sugar transferase [Hysterangium stoloniferum]|nr:nucleotide-diphospho-sugar transferase [Hysterangium stoloniferum]